MKRDWLVGTSVCRIQDMLFFLLKETLRGYEGRGAGRGGQEKEKDNQGSKSLKKLYGGQEHPHIDRSIDFQQ
jgi:hypothetical protein